MANQIVVSAGAKVRNLSGVLTATSGVVSFLPIDVSLGIPQLDVNGKILVSQLPNSVMEYKGTWDASTNTPTLANGTGNQGDVYLCNVAGTVNFGAGAIAFVVGDSVIYSGSIWQRASGATGTVTSVAVTETGDSLNITGSPITTSGTINIGFNGTNLQYVNGAGNLTTFPILTGYVTAVSGTAPVVSSGGTTPVISMAAATSSVDGYLLATDFAIFSAKQSALTFSSPLVNTSGTISIPAATTSVNGYLASADFTTFNNKQNAITLTTTGSSGASTLVGATLNIPNYSSALTGYVPYTGATQDVDLGAFKLNAQSLHIKGTAGNGHLGLKHQSASATASANEVSLFADSLGDLGWQNGNLYLSKFIISGNTAARSYTFPNANGTVALTSDISYPVTSVFGRTGAVVAVSADYNTSQVTEVTNLYFTDSRARLALSFVAGSGAYNSTTGVITIPTNNNQITNGAGYTTNVGTVTSVAATGGTGISISGSPITTSGTITITNTAPDQTVALTASTGISVTGTYPNFTITNTSPSSGGTVTSVAALTIGTTGTDLSSSVATSTTTPVITLNVPTASAANRGALSSADWTTFNNKQSALTNPVTGTGTTNYLPKFTGASTIGDSVIQEASNNIGIGHSPSYKFDVNNVGGSSATARLYGNDQANVRLRLENTGGRTWELTGGLTGANNSTFTIYDVTAAATRLQIDASGNLGLGVTPSAWSTSFGIKVIDLGSKGSVYASDNDANLSFNQFFDGTNAVYKTTGTAGRFAIIGNEFQWRQAPSGTAGNAISFTQAMTLTANGELLVSRTSSVNGGTNFALQIGNGSADKRILIDGTTNYQIGIRNTTNGVFYVGADTSGNGIFSNNAGSELMRLNASGNLSIGNTNDTYKLDVSGTAVIRNDGAAFQLLSSSTSTQYQKWSNAGGNYFVGISSSTGGGLLGSQNSYSFCLVTESARDMSFGTSNLSRMTIFSDGNVGINTGSTNAGYKLDVNGTGRFSDVLSVFVGGNDTRLANFSTSTYGSARGLRINSYQSSNGGQDCAIEFDSGVGGYGGFKFSNSGTAMLTLFATGAATFSSTVSATSYNRSAAGTGFLNGKYAGVENTTTTGPIYCIGDAYVPTSTSLNTMYGIGYSYNNFTGKYGPSDTWGMYIAANGSANIFLGGSGQGYFNSTVTASGFFESSDKRIKTLIQDNYQTKGIASITPKLYTKNGKVELGYYAQDFVGILDSAVSIGSDDMLSLSYREVHTAKIYALEQEIKELKAKMN